MSEATAITAVQQRHNPLSSTVAFPKKLQDPYTNVWSTRTADTTRIVGFANTDPLVEAHVLHERVLARAHSDLAVHKHQPRSRLQRIDNLLVELALITKLVSRDLASVFDTTVEHIRTLRSSKRPWVSTSQDTSIRIILEYLRNIQLADECPYSAQHSVQAVIVGLESVLHEHFASNFSNFNYIYLLV